MIALKNPFINIVLSCIGTNKKLAITKQGKTRKVLRPDAVTLRSWNDFPRAVTIPLPHCVSMESFFEVYFENDEEKMNLFNLGNLVIKHKAVFRILQTIINFMFWYSIKIQGSIILDTLLSPYMFWYRSIHVFEQRAILIMATENQRASDIKPNH